eukprot:3637765-Rhodomonas_salina.1
MSQLPRHERTMLCNSLLSTVSNGFTVQPHVFVPVQRGPLLMTRAVHLLQSQGFCNCRCRAIGYLVPGIERSTPAARWQASQQL